MGFKACRSDGASSINQKRPNQHGQQGGPAIITHPIADSEAKQNSGPRTITEPGNVFLHPTPSTSPLSKTQLDGRNQQLPGQQLDGNESTAKIQITTGGLL
ncbi:hypothetical protein ACLOJK_029276 [Asimina triloba]